MSCSSKVIENTRNSVKQYIYMYIFHQLEMPQWVGIVWQPRSSTIYLNQECTAFSGPLRILDVFSTCSVLVGFL